MSAAPGAGVAYLFGGRSGETARSDLWSLDLATTTWNKIAGTPAPGPRFGHNAAVVGGELVVFGGQSDPGTFLNDVWVFDPKSATWSARAVEGAKPAARYGAGDAVVAGSMFMTHGFTHQGRFDDSWLWKDGWTKVGPSTGTRPVKRCLHRSTWWEQAGGVALFGGQTNGTPFLNDFWLFSPTERTWTEIKTATSPAPRTLFSMVSLGDRLWIYGGNGPAGALGDTWSLAAPSEGWEPVTFADGAFPLPRGGMATTAISAGEALMFGGRRDQTDLAELWSLRAN